MFRPRCPFFGALLPQNTSIYPFRHAHVIFVVRNTECPNEIVSIHYSSPDSFPYSLHQSMYADRTRASVTSDVSISPLYSARSHYIKTRHQADGDYRSDNRTGMRENSSDEFPTSLEKSSFTSNVPLSLTRRRRSRPWRQWRPQAPRPSRVRASRPASVTIFGVAVVMLHVPTE